MPVGLRVYNSATGSIQIDELYKNLSLRTKGSATTTGNYCRAAITFTGGTMPVLALRNAAGRHISVFSVEKSGSTFTWWVEAGGFLEAQVSFDYYIFDVPPSGGSGANVGLQVFNSAGELTFDSGLKYMRVVDFITGTNPASGPDTMTTHNYPSGKVYAVAVGTAGLYNLPGGTTLGGNFTVRMRGFRNVSATQITTSRIDVVAQAGILPTGGATLVWGFLVLDVTNQ